MIEYIASGKETADVKQNDILSCYYLRTPIQVYSTSLWFSPQALMAELVIAQCHPP
jgi:hypothetical protein